MTLRPLAMLAVCACATPLAAVELARDGFEGGIFGPLWIGTTSVSLSSDRAHGGSRAAKFHFAGDPAITGDAWSELRFDLGAVHPELWIRYQLYIPGNYAHRDADGASDNNKFIRLWGSTYDDLEKAGASTWLDSPPDGFSALITDWNRHGDGIGPKGGAFDRFIGPADRGTWIDVMIHAKAATATAFGGMRFWKNGVLAIDGTGTMDNYTPGEAHGYRYGYLLGWANTGFAADTDLYIDDVVFGTTQADVQPPAGNHAPVAATQSVTTTGGTPVAITLQATDADGDALTWTIVTGPAHGTLSGSGPALTYTPSAGYLGGDAFAFTASDASAASAAATVAITVAAAPGGDPPAGGPAATPASHGTAGGSRCGDGVAMGLILAFSLLLAAAPRTRR